MTFTKIKPLENLYAYGIVIVIKVKDQSLLYVIAFVHHFHTELATESNIDDIMNAFVQFHLSTKMYRMEDVIEQFVNKPHAFR